MSNIPTVEETYLKYTKCVMNHGDIKKAMVEFAKLHVEIALREASEKATTKEDVAIFAEGTYRTQIIDRDSILNAYPLTNIK